MQDQDVKLKLSLINGLLNYLGTRPFMEVADIIMAVREQAQPQIQMPAEVVPAEKPADAQVQ